MVKARYSVSVDRPIDEVFDFLAEGTNNPIWRPSVTLVAHIRQPEDEPGIHVGTTYLQKITDGRGRVVEETYEITRYDRPNALEFVVMRGQTRSIGRYALVCVDPRTTHVEFTLRSESPSFSATVTRTDGGQLQDQVASIARLPAALNDALDTPT